MEILEFLQNTGIGNWTINGVSIIIILKWILNPVIKKFKKIDELDEGLKEVKTELDTVQNEVKIVKTDIEDLTDKIDKYVIRDVPNAKPKTSA